MEKRNARLYHYKYCIPVGCCKYFTLSIPIRRLHAEMADMRKIWAISSVRFHVEYGFFQVGLDFNFIAQSQSFVLVQYPFRGIPIDSL